MNGVIGMTELLLDTELTRRAARVRRDGAAVRRGAAGDHQRHPGLLQDRGRQARPRSDVDFDLRSAVEDVLELLAERAPRQGPRAGVPRCTRTCRPGCAATPAGCARCSPTWSATPSSSPTRGEVVVARRARRADRRRTARASRFEVTDTGIGIAAEATRRGCSSRSPRPTARRRAGTAAPASGWRSRKRLVEMMGGAIGVESAPGRAARSGSRSDCAKRPAAATAGGAAAQLRRPARAGRRRQRDEPRACSRASSAPGACTWTSVAERPRAPSSACGWPPDGAAYDSGDPRPPDAGHGRADAGRARSARIRRSRRSRSCCSPRSATAGPTADAAACRLQRLPDQAGAPVAAATTAS